MGFQRRERKNIRLSGYNYSSDGYYFVTICTKHMVNYFGEIQNGFMSLNKIGCMISQFWQEIPNHFEGVILDEWVVMPNHFHGIVVIDGGLVGDAVGRGGLVGDADLRPLPTLTCDRTKMLLPKIIHGFKSSVTRQIRKIDSNSIFEWQRFYYDHIIRDKKSLNRIRNYIQNNPLNWDLDRNHF